MATEPPSSTSPLAPLPPPECTVFPARKEHTATVILLHGLGDSAKYFCLAFDSLIKHPDLEHVKFIFPSAHEMRVTGNRNATMPSWFDVYSFDIATRREDEQGLWRAVGWVKDIVEKEEKEHGIASERVVVGGLSQGGALAILTALTMEKPIAGLVALSTYIPLRSRVPEFAAASVDRIPILWCHGTDDKQVNCEDWQGFAEVMAGQLSLPFVTSDATTELEFDDKDDGTVVHFRRYVGLGHWVELAELADVGTWIKMRIPKTE